MTSAQRKRRQSARRERQRAAAIETRDLNFREIALRAESVDAENRSVEAVFATEQPVPMWDYERWEIVPEVLLMSGVVLPKSRQVPFLDSHKRNSVDDQLGSGREMRVDGDQLIGRLFFSSEEQEKFTKVREGHVNDVSAGYANLKVTHVPAGQTQKIGGRKFEGPVNVVEKWKIREISLVPIGADDQAKLRGYDPEALKGPKPRSKPVQSPPATREGFIVNPELKAALVERGMDPNLSDEDAQKWMLDDFKARADKKAAKKAAKAAKNGGKRGKPTAGDGEGNRGEGGRADWPAYKAGLETLIADATAKALAEREQRQLAFRGEVDQLCELAGVDRPDRFYGKADLAAVRAALIDERKERAPTIGFAPMSITGGEAQLDKHRGAVGTALIMRCLQNALDAGATGGKKKLKEIFPKDQRAAGWEQFRYASLTDLGQACLQMDGFDTRGLTREQIAIAALGWPEKVGLRMNQARSDLYGAYHTTGSFALLTADAVNKSMQVGYQEYPATWRGPGRQGTSAPDFKTIHRLRLGAAPNLQAWPDNTDPAQVSFKDADETYAVEAYSEEFGFSYRLMVNDDMDALSRAPAMFGMAAARTVNATFWAQITSNPTMSDGQPLFVSAATGNRKRANLITGQAGPPSTANLQLLINLMMQMRGENTPENNEANDILSLMPRYIVGPSALYTTISQLVKSAFDPAANEFMLYNTAGQLTPVIEPLLDLTSTTAWYVFASTAMIDTVEVTFLQGQETPVTRDWIDERKLSHNWAVLQTFAAKALNHRGIGKHNGA